MQQIQDKLEENQNTWMKKKKKQIVALSSHRKAHNDFCADPEEGKIRETDGWRDIISN